MTTNNTTKLDPGAYMSGTMLDRDLLGMFRTIALITGDEGLEHDVALATEYLDLVEWFEVREDANEESCSCSACMRPYLDANGMVEDSINDFFDYVNEHHTPKGFYFGAHEGDGACYGVWEAEEHEEDEGWTEVPVTFTLLIDPTKQNRFTAEMILRIMLTKVTADYGGVEGWSGLVVEEPE
jgi:hypothetical protein